MSNSNLLRTGLFGTVITALCCFTPLLAVMLTGLGLAWMLGYADYVLLPMLAGFAGLTLFALNKRRTS